MKKISYSILKIAVIIVVMLGVFSCSKEEDNINNLKETIFVRHKKADMPAYIHGNASKKVFLIILHGGPGGNGLWYRVNTIRTEIEKNNAVVYFDQRGHNNAQGNYSEKEVSIDIMAEDVVALAKVIKKKYGEESKLFLMGHSWGGTLGPAALVKNQNLFSGWINVAGAHDPKGLFNAYKTTLSTIATAQINEEHSVDYWNRTLDKVQNIGETNTVDSFGTLNTASHDGEFKLEEDKVINKSKADYGDSPQSDNFFKITWNSNKIQDILMIKQGLFQKVSFTNKLPEITIPSIVLWGKYDLVVPVTFAHEAYDNLGSTTKELFIFQKSGHSPMLSEPNLFSDKLIEFINSN